MIDELVAHDEAKFADHGGFISPSGLSFIGRSPSLITSWQLAAAGRDAVADNLPAAAGSLPTVADHVLSGAIFSPDKCVLSLIPQNARWP